MDNKLFLEKCKKIQKVVDREFDRKNKYFFFISNINNDNDNEDFMTGTNLSHKMQVYELEKIIEYLKSDPDYEKSPYCLCCGSMEAHE